MIIAVAGHSSWNLEDRFLKLRVVFLSWVEMKEIYALGYISML